MHYKLKDIWDKIRVGDKLNENTVCGKDLGIVWLDHFANWYYRYSNVPFTWEPCEPTLNNLIVGDYVVSNSAKRMVLVVNGELVALSQYGNYASYFGWFTLSSLREYGYVVVKPEAPTEMTHAEIEKALGKKIK